MAEEAIFLNSGPLFSGEKLESLEETPEWGDDDAARDAFERIKEQFEKHATLLAGNPSVEETRFFMINPTLHALGYTFSVAETLELGSDRSVRVDYVCFGSSADFYEATPARGSMGFFRPALALVKAVEWGYQVPGDAEPAAGAEGEADEAPVETQQINPVAELDLLLRTSGKDYGILTNGCDWRLYHRGTSSLLNTFFQADMIAAMKSDFEDFKRFYLLFRKDALLRDDSGTCFLDRMLQ